MKNLKLDTGVVSYRLGEGVLRFNPADPNVYVRFSQALDKLQQLEKELPRRLQNEEVLAVMADLDRVMKEELGRVFGPGNDFDAMLGGVNLLSAASDGAPVVRHLFAALEPVLTEGARRCAGQQAEAAKARARARRENR